MKHILILITLLLLSQLNCFSNDGVFVRTDFLLANLPAILLGFLLIVIGLVTALVFLFKRKLSELNLLYLAVFITGYGIRVIADNELVRQAVNAPGIFWDYISASITDILPIFFILFLKSFIGWGWKRSVFWLLLVWIAFALTEITVGIISGIPHLVGGTIINNILVIMIVVVLVFNRFHVPRKNTREDEIIGTGLFVFVTAVFYNNLVSPHFFMNGTTVERGAFFFFICCMIYASIRRSIRTEREFQTIMHDLETARQIQLAILPQRLPESPCWVIFPTYIPMTLIGGDFYTFHKEDDKHVGILMADVSGHGISASLLASMIKVAFNSLVSHAAHPSLLLESINNALTGQLNNEFITTAYLWFDFSEMTLHHSSAGHPHPVLVREGKAEDKSFTVKGIPIGISENVKYIEEKIEISKGDRIVVYTDGLTEVFNLQGQLFGKERLLSGLANAKHLPVEKVSDQMIGKVIAWSGRGKAESLDDDVTVIVIDVK